MVIGLKSCNVQSATCNVLIISFSSGLLLLSVFYQKSVWGMNCIEFEQIFVSVVVIVNLCEQSLLAYFNNLAYII